MPLTNPPDTHTHTNLSGPISFFAATPQTQPTGYSWTYNTSALTLPAYTPNVQSSAYLGGLLDLLQAARLSDLNTLRVAVENLRVFSENVAKQHNHLCQDLVAYGLIST